MSSPFRSDAAASHDLHGFRVAALVEDRFEQVEFTSPRTALEAAGAHVDLVSRHHALTGMNGHDPGDPFIADVSLELAGDDRYDGLLLPGGVVSGDKLRMVVEAQRFVRAMVEPNKPVAVICHGGWILISAGLVRGRTLTSYYTLQDDYRNAGAHWEDEPVVVENNWVSSRSPADLAVFNPAMVDLFARSYDRRRAA